LLAELQPALELKIVRKAALEAELKNLIAEIEANKKKIAELPRLTEKIQKEATTALIESNQLRTKLSTLSNTQEADQKLLENISNMISGSSSVISKYLSILFHQTFCIRMIHHPCNFSHHKLYFPIFVLPYFSEQLLDDSFGNSSQTVIDPNSDLTATQPNFNQSN
jgi:regulator of replication initiation timing